MEFDNRLIESLDISDSIDSFQFFFNFKDIYLLPANKTKYENFVFIRLLLLNSNKYYVFLLDESELQLVNFTSVMNNNLWHAECHQIIMYYRRSVRVKLREAIISAKCCLLSDAFTVMRSRSRLRRFRGEEPLGNRGRVKTISESGVLSGPNSYDKFLNCSVVYLMTFDSTTHSLYVAITWGLFK